MVLAECKNGSETEYFEKRFVNTAPANFAS